jgi:riboflavin biosynthesis pyrimidine reductase
VAPKIVGGINAPTPVGELGMSQMTQAISFIDVAYEQVNSSDTFHSTHISETNRVGTLLHFLLTCISL